MVPCRFCSLLNVFSFHKVSDLCRCDWELEICAHMFTLSQSPACLLRGSLTDTLGLKCLVSYPL